MGIRNQIITMFLIVVLPSFAASLFLLIGMRNVIRDKSLETAAANAETLAFWVSDTVSMGEKCSQSICENPTIREFITSHYENSAAYYHFYSENTLSRLINIPSQAANIQIYIDREDFVFNNTYLQADSTIRNSEWYRAAVKSDNVVWCVVKNSEGKVSLACAQAIREGNEVIGVSCINLSDSWLDTLKLDNTLYVLLSMDGIVYYSNYSAIPAGTNLNIYADYKDAIGVETYPEGLYGFPNYAVLKTTIINEDHHGIALLLSGSFINYDANRISLIYGGYCALMIVLSLLTILLFTSTFSSRIKTLSDKMHEVTEGNFNVDFTENGTDEISQLYADIGMMISTMQKLINDNYQAKLESEAFKLNQVQAEFKALSSQINPHFLYNTLETIRMKAYVNNDKETADLVKKLGKFMRRCLEFKDAEVPLHSELEFTNAYLELQSARFGDRIRYHFYSEVDGDYMILPLLIQPLVENAFVHGVEASKGGGRIDIRVCYHGDEVRIDVEDNGQGMSEEKLRELELKLEISDTSSGKSIGLTNVHKRIQMYHGSRYGMRVQSTEGEGTTITLVLPREPKFNEKMRSEDDKDKKDKKSKKNDLFDK